MIKIVYPADMLVRTGVRQAFTLAVMHGLCIRMNGDTNTQRRHQNHAFRAGYWFGRVSAFVQLRPAAIGHGVNFDEKVLEEISRLQKELEKENIDS